MLSTEESAAAVSADAFVLGRNIDSEYIAAADTLISMITAVNFLKKFILKQPFLKKTSVLIIMKGRAFL
jgi:hypothetical protein